VNATLQLFEREGVPGIYPSKISIIRVFRRGEIFAICKVKFAQAPTGMDMRELAMVVLRVKDDGDAVLRKAVAFSIVNVMRVRLRRDKTMDAGRRRGARMWRTGYAVSDEV
jgi:hypothetical protein